MELINSCYNIINKVLDSNINILYEPHNTVFDYIIQSLDYNFLLENNSFFDGMYYDFGWINNWQKHAVQRQSYISKHQIMDLVIFHENCPNQFKKEDKIILSNNLSKTVKIFPTLEIYNSWNLSGNNNLQINYGIPSNHQIIPTNKEVITIIKSSNNESQALYQYIKNYYNNTIIINNNIPYKDLIEIINKSKVVIDTQSAINNLLSISIGTISITNKNIDKNLKSIIVVNDLRNIPEIIKNISYEKLYNNLILDKNYINIHYNYDNFNKNITSLVKRIKMEPFIL